MGIPPLTPRVVALRCAEVPHILPWPTHLKIPVSAPGTYNYINNLHVKNTLAEVTIMYPTMSVYPALGCSSVERVVIF